MKADRWDPDFTWDRTTTRYKIRYTRAGVVWVEAEEALWVRLFDGLVGYAVIALLIVAILWVAPGALS